MTKIEAKEMLLKVINSLQLTHKDREILWLAVQTLEGDEKKDGTSIAPIKSGK
jgi:hypothetical protein